MLNSKVFAMVLLVSVPAQADWFCQEASSQKTGSWITTCGKATAKTEAQARIDAREKAIEEFKRVCNVSKDCRDFDFSMKPMRTECSADGSSVTCVRALEFEILDVERTTIEPDVITVEEQIKDHNQQIQELQVLVAKAKESKTVRRELAMVKQDLNNETGEGRLYSPNQATLYDDGTLLIADTDNHRVLVVRDGLIKTEIRNVNNPTSVAFWRAGKEVAK